MKRVIFTNTTFRSLLISYLIILLIYNIYVSIRLFLWSGLLSICFDIILLVLILIKNRYAKLCIILWVSIALIFAFGFDAIADLLDGFNNNFEMLKINSFIFNIIQVIIGVLILDYTRRTVIISSDADLHQNSGINSL